MLQSFVQSSKHCLHILNPNSDFQGMMYLLPDGDYRGHHTATINPQDHQEALFTRRLI